MSKEFAISKELAEENLQEILDFYEIDLEADVAADEGLDKTAARARVAGMKKKLINALRAGRLEPQVEGRRMVVTQKLDGEYKGLGDTLKWFPPKGLAKAGIKITDSNASVKQVYDMAAGFTRTGVSHILELEGLDLSTAETMTALFLLI